MCPALTIEHSVPMKTGRPVQSGTRAEQLRNAVSRPLCTFGSRSVAVVERVVENAYLPCPQPQMLSHSATSMSSLGKLAAHSAFRCSTRKLRSRYCFAGYVLAFSGHSVVRLSAGPSIVHPALCSSARVKLVHPLYWKVTMGYASKYASGAVLAGGPRQRRLLPLSGAVWF